MMKKMIDEKALENVTGGVNSSLRRQLFCWECGETLEYSSADIYDAGGYFVATCKNCGEEVDWEQ